jgi:HlyD family secretion protein
MIPLGCRNASAETAPEFQGVVELDEWRLGFEVAGRLATVPALRGAVVKENEPLATLDTAMEATQRAARTNDAEAAAAELALLRAGSRAEDVRSMEAQVRASKASEELLGKNLLREQALLARGATTTSAVDDLKGNFDRAMAERQALEQRLAALRRGSRPEELSAAAARAAAASAAVQLEAERLDRHTLLSPAKGVVLDVHAKIGEVVAAGAPVVTIGDASHPFADVFVPQAGLARLKVGTGAELRVDGEPQAFRGAIETIAHKTEFTPRYLFSERERPNLVVRVRVRIQDPAEQLHAGVPARVRFDGAGASP